MLRLTSQHDSILYVWYRMSFWTFFVYFTFLSYFLDFFFFYFDDFFLVSSTFYFHLPFRCSFCSNNSTRWLKSSWRSYRIGRYERCSLVSTFSFTRWHFMLFRRHFFMILLFMTLFFVTLFVILLSAIVLFVLILFVVIYYFIRQFNKF